MEARFAVSSPTVAPGPRAFRSPARHWKPSRSSSVQPFLNLTQATINADRSQIVTDFALPRARASREDGPRFSRTQAAESQMGTSAGTGFSQRAGTRGGPMRLALLLSVLVAASALLSAFPDVHGRRRADGRLRLVDGRPLWPGREPRRRHRLLPADDSLPGLTGDITPGTFAVRLDACDSIADSSIVSYAWNIAGAGRRARAPRAS